METELEKRREKNRQRQQRYRERNRGAGQENVIPLPRGATRNARAKNVAQSVTTERYPVTERYVTALPCHSCGATSEASEQQTVELRNVVTSNDVTQLDSDVTSKVTRHNAVKIVTLTLLVTLVTSLLTLLQIEAYTSQQIAHPWITAIVCELVLITLASMSFKGGFNRFLAATLWVGMFAYSLGVMSFDVVTRGEREITITSDASVLKDGMVADVSLMREALRLAVERRESGNVARITASLTAAEHRLAEARAESISVASQHVPAKSYGLVILRAILMVFCGLMTHELVKALNAVLLTRRSSLGQL